jgi:hypothetical protein
MPQLITEVNRLKRLAGILTEAEENQENKAKIEADLKAAFVDALKGLKAIPKQVEPAEDDKPSEKGDKLEVNEIAATLAVAGGLTASAPKLMELIGKAIKFGAKHLSFGYASYSADIVGKWLEDHGKELEKSYMIAIGDALKAIYPEKYRFQDVTDHNSALYIAAHGLYATILTGLAGSSFADAAHAHSAISGAVEGGLGSIKASEVAALASKITKAS